MALNTVQQPPNANANFTPASLYVGDLKPEVTEALLFDAFNTVGPVASIRVCRDVVSRRSLGYAYVNFHNVNDAERALDTMNYSSIRGRPCRIMWSQRDPSLRKSGVGNIFVKNLDKSIDHKTLYDTFSMFGSILSCKVATNEQGESLGYGFVHYESQDSAQKAIEKVNGMVIASREVHVAPFTPKAQRDGGDSRATFTNVYVKGLKDDCSDDAKLNEMFAPYGNITSSYLATDGDGKPRGFGFINYEQPEEAHAAVMALNGHDGLYVGRAQKKEEREKELRDKFEQMRLQQAEKYAGVNLYVKNLADTVTSEVLEEEFKQFGKIHSAKVMEDSNKRSKGFGFVCFTSRDEAAKAVAEMNGKMLHQKPLYVAPAQRKEVRRQQLEAQAQANRNRQAAGPMAPQMYPPQPMFYQQPPGPVAARAAGGFMYPPPGAQQAAMMAQQQRWTPRTPQNPMMMQRPGQPPVQGMYMMSQQQQMAQQQQGRGGPGGMMGGPGGPGGMRGRGRNGPKPGGRGGQMGGPGGQPKGGPVGPQGHDQRIQFAQGVRNPQPPQASGMVPNGVPNGPQGGPGGAVPPQSAQVQGGPGGAPGGGPGSGHQQPPTAQQPLTSQALARAPSQQQKQMIGEQIFPKIQEVQPNLAGKITGMLLEMDNTELLHLLESPDALNAKIAEAMTVLRQSDDERNVEGDAGPAQGGAANAAGQGQQGANQEVAAAN